MNKSLSLRRVLLGLNKLEQVSCLVLAPSINRSVQGVTIRRTIYYFMQMCERLLPFAMLTHCFLSSVRCSSLALLCIWTAWILWACYILAGQRSPHWQLHVCRSSLKKDNVLTIAFSSIPLFFCTLVTDQHCSNECSQSQLLFGVFICKFHTVPLFQLDAFALAHLRTGLLLSLYILNSFSELNESAKRYQKF